MMKTTLFAVFAVLSIVIVTVESEWTGAVKTVTDAVPLSSATVKAVTADIFSKLPLNCNKLVQVPSKEFMPIPTTHCNTNRLGLLKDGCSNPSSFDVDDFLNAFFFYSNAGKLLKEYFTGKGVTEHDYKEAVKQTWSSKQNCEGSSSAFGRTFFNQGEQAFRANSWYTYVNYQDQCTKKNHRVNENEDFVDIVEASCEGLDFKSSFVFPNHPFEDLVIYTLCAWRSDNEDCMVSVVKREGIKVNVSFGTDNESQYLISAKVEFPE